MNCPICGYKRFYYESYHEDMGTVEQHGYCGRCGYSIEQAYSRPIEGFAPMRKRGYKDYCGKYHEKNMRKQKRMKRKFEIKYRNEDRIFAYI